MQKARSTLVKLVAEQLRMAPANTQPLLAWPIVCGPRVAEKTQPIEFANGELRVLVPDRTWQSQLGGLAAQYLAGAEIRFDELVDGSLVVPASEANGVYLFFSES